MSLHAIVQEELETTVKVKPVRRESVVYVLRENSRPGEAYAL